MICERSVRNFAYNVIRSGSNDDLSYPQTADTLSLQAGNSNFTSIQPPCKTLPHYSANRIPLCSANTDIISI